MSALQADRQQGTVRRARGAPQPFPPPPGILGQGCAQRIVAPLSRGTAEVCTEGRRVGFRIHRPYEPAGDQPAAIEALTNGILKGQKSQVLMGVTGSGKTFTMANVIQNVQKPTLVISHNKTLAAQLYGEFKEFFPAERRALFRQLLRLLSARSVHSAARYLHRERCFDQSGTRPPATGHHQFAGQPAGCDHRRQRVVHLRLGLSQRLQSDDGRPGGGQVIDRDEMLERMVDIQYDRNDVSFERGKFRVRGDSVEIWPSYEEFALRIEFWGDEIENLSIINPTSGETICSRRNCSSIRPSTS